MAANGNLAGVCPAITTGYSSNRILTPAERAVLCAAVVSLVAIRLWMMSTLPLTDTTEARYAEIARKMLETGNWITPQYDYGVPFWGKPPLHTWASALGMAVLGVGEFAARLPILLASGAVLWAVFAFVQRVLGSDQALICIAVLSSSVLFFGASAFVMTDITLTLGTTLCMCGFYLAVTKGEHNKPGQVLFFAGLAIGLLAKGPVATVLTGIPIFVWLLIGRRWRMLRHLHWGKGLVCAALLFVPWYLAAEWATPGFLRYFFVGEHFERFVVSNWQGDLYGSGHPRPKGMIWLYAFAAFLPWVFFAAALFRYYRGIAYQLIDDTRGWYSYLLLWAISPMILFTPAANILAAYVLPGLPAASILLVSLWCGAHMGAGRRARYLFAGTLGSASATYVAVAAIVAAAPESLNLRTEKFLIERARTLNPDVQITYWGKRIYSAEFYTVAKVDFVTEPTAVTALLENKRIDAVAIPASLLPDLQSVLADGFTRAGQYRNKVLFVETGRSEVQ